MNREGKPLFTFVGDSHIASRALSIYFSKWECINCGLPAGGISLDTNLTLDGFHLNGK